MKRRLFAALLGMALAAEHLAQDSGGAIVQLADGSSVPLVSFALSYEYLAWRQGTPQYQATPQRRDATELWLGKKTYPVKGQLLVVRTLDVKGETLTGTRCLFCLASFTSLVECPEEPANQVVRIDFP